LSQPILLCLLGELAAALKVYGQDQTVAADHFFLLA
jgi:hypothetical protein